MENKLCVGVSRDQWRKTMHICVTLCSHSLCWVWECAGQRISLYALARNPHKGLRSRTSTRPEVEEERKGRTKWRQGLIDKGIQREQSTTESRGRTVSRRRQWGKTVKNELTLLVAFVEVRAKYTPTIVYKCTKSCTKSS